MDYLDANLINLGEGEFQAQLICLRMLRHGSLISQPEMIWWLVRNITGQINRKRRNRWIPSLLLGIRPGILNKKFSLSDTGELVALQSFDLEEMGDELSIRVQVIDEYGEVSKNQSGACA